MNLMPAQSAGLPPSDWTRRNAVLFAMSLGIVLLTGGCFGRSGEATLGAVHWDRDVDEECGMVVSDRRFAAQAVEPTGRVHNFGDAGCLVVWLEKQPWKSQAHLWVRDRNADRWIAANAARWRAGESTPSAYGYGASLNTDYGSLTWDQVREAILQAKIKRPGAESPARQGRRPR